MDVILVKRENLNGSEEDSFFEKDNVWLLLKRENQLHQVLTRRY